MGTHLQKGISGRAGFAALEQMGLAAEHVLGYET